MLDHLKTLNILEPMMRHTVPVGHNVKGLHAFRDGSPNAFGTVLYVISYHPEDPEVLYYNILGSKSKLSLKTVPVNESLSTPLSLSFLTKAATALKPYISRYEKEDLLFASTGDSRIISYYYNPKRRVTDVLNRNACLATVSFMNDL